MGLFEEMEKGKGKTEPNADLREAATQMWQMYIAFKDAGFSKADALSLVGETLRGIMASATAVSPEDKQESQ